MKFKVKRLTKAIAEAAKQRRVKMFNGLEGLEIQTHVPINKGYLYEYENNGRCNWGLYIQECVLCGDQHKHGNGGSGEYSIHCIVNPEEVYPFAYNVQLDMDDEDNIKLAEKYGVK